MPVPCSVTSTTGCAGVAVLSVTDRCGTVASAAVRCFLSRTALSCRSALPTRFAMTTSKRRGSSRAVNAVGEVGRHLLLIVPVTARQCLADGLNDIGLVGAGFRGTRVEP